MNKLTISDYFMTLNLFSSVQSVLGEALTDAATQMEARSSSDMMRDQAGFSGEVSSADMTSMSTNKQGFVQKAFEGYQAAQSSSSNRRKRRNTGEHQPVLIIDYDIEPIIYLP